MKTRTFLLVLAVLYLSLFTVHAAAAPVAQSGEECVYAADMGLSARAMTQEGLSPEKITAILKRMYIAPSAPGWISVIVKAVKNEERNPQDYGQALQNHCLANRGRMDSFFGVQL